MGWLSMPLSSMFPHTGPKAYLDAQFTYDNRDADGKGKALRVIASSCLRNKVWYAAVVPSTDGTDCQSASKEDPLSASKRDPLCRAV